MVVGSWAEAEEGSDLLVYAQKGARKYMWEH